MGREREQKKWTLLFVFALHVFVRLPYSRTTFTQTSQFIRYFLSTDEIRQDMEDVIARMRPWYIKIINAIITMSNVPIHMLDPPSF